MINPDVRAYRAMSHMKANELAPFVEYLSKAREATLEKITSVVDPVMLGRLQGEANCLKSLLEDIDQAHARMMKLSSGQTR